MTHLTTNYVMIDHVMIQNQTGPFPNKWGKSGVVVELKDYHQYVVKVDGSGRLTVRNGKFLRKFNPPGCKSLSSIPYLRKANIPLQKCVFSGYDEKRRGFNCFSSHLANPYSGVLMADSTGLKGQLGLWTFAIPYNLPGLRLRWVYIFVFHI